CLLAASSPRPPGPRHAVVVSADGLRLAASQAVGEDLGDQLAAVTSGLLSLAQGVASSFAAGPVRQTIVEMSGGYLFLTSISEGSMLAVFAERACDMAMIGYEMRLLARRVGAVRPPVPPPARARGRSGPARSDGGMTADDRVVPVYAFTRGRTRAVGQDLPLEAVVTATGLSLATGAALQMASRTIVELCAHPKSLAEVGAALKVPVGVARVLVGDLANG